MLSPKSSLNPWIILAEVVIAAATVVVDKMSETKR